jgi:hypothetical protein
MFFQNQYPLLSFLFSNTGEVKSFATWELCHCGTRPHGNASSQRCRAICCSIPPVLSDDMLSFAVSVLKAEITCVVAVISIIDFVFENYTKV